ncbi:ComEC family competence protein [Bacteroidales bacterium Barb6]|nr:ComEC family competence protein [Bacteroidales bacterium Barb6]
MIAEIQKRPFARPLLWWITGILLQTCLPCRTAAALLLPAFLFVISSAAVSCFGKPPALCYSTRWVWGMLCALLVISLSVAVAEYAERRIPSTGEPAGLMPAASRSQQRLTESVDRLRLTDTEKSVFAALTIGYRKAMPREIREHFAVSGVSHILSVSGFHVAIVCGFLGLLLGFLPHGNALHWLTFLLQIGLLWGYVLVTGLAAASVRSALMLSFYLAGRAVRQTADAYNTLAAAAFCMLAYNPFYLFDIGFQLSYISVWFILYLQPVLQRLIPVRNPLLAQPWSWITVTLAAQTGTAFLCLHYFGYFSLVFLFANVPVMLYSVLLIPAGLLWLLLPDGMPGYALLQLAVEKLTCYTVYTVDLFGSLSGAAYPLRFDTVSLLAGYAMLLLALLYLSNRRPRILLASLSALLFLLLYSLATTK